MEPSNCSLVTTSTHRRNSVLQTKFNSKFVVIILNEYNQITFKRELNDYNYKNIENMIREIFKYFYFDESINSDSIVTIEVSHEGSMSHGVGYYKDFI